MSFGFLDIDHLVVRVADLLGAVGRFEELGFTVAPERRPAGAGKEGPPFALRHLLFQPAGGRDDIANFLVLQCVQRQYDIPLQQSQLMGFMQDTEGLRAMIGYAPDPEGSRAAMEAAGIEIAPSAWRVEENWEGEGGELLPVESQPLMPMARRTPYFIGGFQTKTLASFRYPPWTRHRNGALHIAGVTGVTERLAEDATIMGEGVFGVEPEWIGDDQVVIRPRDLFLRMVTPDGFAELYPGLSFSSERILPALCGITFAVDSLDQATDVFEGASLEHHMTPAGTLVLPRSTAANTILEFAPPGTW